MNIRRGQSPLRLVEGDSHDVGPHIHFRRLYLKCS
jgi:hypothetical protein